MIIVALKGGLGNQMFQYATARGICKGNEKVVLDLSFLKKHSIGTNSFTPRSYELSIFSEINARLASNLLYRILYGSNLIFKIGRKLFHLKVKKVAQHENEFVTALQNGHRSIYLDGYFQSEKYFFHIRKELLEEFKFPGLAENDLDALNVLTKIRSIRNATAIHVRRGDYLKPLIQEYHGVMPISYFKNAIDKIEALVSDPYYFIFSDDPLWCAENFKFIDDRMEIVDSKDSKNAWKDMFLMSQCEHHIISNSSFGWWGAWLSSRGGYKFAPLRWFNPEIAKFNIEDFVPKTWHLVSNV